MKKRDLLPSCHFCGSKFVLVENVFIAIGMGGSEYAFCEECLRSESAYHFWRSLFRSLAYDFPADEFADDSSSVSCSVPRINEPR